MKSPIDGSDRTMAERQGSEIDYCPRCRGVWLDRGELDKIIERSAALEAPTQPEPAYREPERWPPGHDRNRDYEHRSRDHDHRYHGRKRKSFLSDIFDFD